MFCERCRRTGLSKVEVEKDHKRNQILCLGCYSLENPGWSPTPSTETLPVLPEIHEGFGYAVSLDSFRGFSAQVSFGEVALELNVPNKVLKGFLGVR